MLCNAPQGYISLVSGAACLHVAVVWSTPVNRALGLQRGLIFAWGRPVGALTAVPNTIEEVDGETWRGMSEAKGSYETVI